MKPWLIWPNISVPSIVTLMIPCGVHRSGGRTTGRRGLKNTIPVYILYSTVMADPDGTISFY